MFSNDASIYIAGEDVDEGGRNIGWWCDSTTLVVKLLLAVFIVHFLAASGRLVK